MKKCTYIFSLPLLSFALQRRDKVREKNIFNKPTQAAIAVLGLPRSQEKVMFCVITSDKYQH